MIALSRVLLLSVITATGGGAAAQPLAGSRLPHDQNRCAICHGEQDLWGGDNLRLYVPLEQLADDAHWKNGVSCHDCHGGDPSSLNFQQAHATHVDDAASQIKPFRPLLSQQDRTPAHLDTIVQVCSKCHAHAAETYLVSVHGHGFQESGLTVTAVCTDCHGSHGILPASDPRSALNVAHVDTTCAKCHRYIEERLQKSVHGRAARGWRLPPRRILAPRRSACRAAPIVIKDTICRILNRLPFGLHCKIVVVAATPILKTATRGVFTGN